MRLLIIEDDKNLMHSIHKRLKKDFIVDLALEGIEGTYLAQINHYDLIIVDLGLPDIDGIEVCKNIRAAKINAPILVLTGKCEVRHKVSSLDAGADDYLTKPFNYAELLARLRALLRRNPEATPAKQLIVKDLVLDTRTKVVTIRNKVVNLRRKEFDLLEYLMRNQNRVLTRERILEAIWERSLDVTSNTLDVHISSLRKNIGLPYAKNLIKTIHGVGYKLNGKL